MKSKKIKFLESHQSGQESSFEADAQWRAENASWLKRSRSVALAIIDFMQEKGLSRNDVAAMLQVTPQYVSKILSGKVNFSFKTVAEIEVSMSDLLFRNLLVLYLGTFIRFVYLRFIKRKDVRFKELLDPVKESKIKKDDEMDIFTNEMANRSYGCIFLMIIVAIMAYFLA